MYKNPQRVIYKYRDALYIVNYKRMLLYYYSNYYLLLNGVRERVDAVSTVNCTRIALNCSARQL